MPGKFMEQLGNAAASTIPGAVLGIASNIAGNAGSWRREKKRQALQIAGNKELSDYQLKQQLELWEKTGYGAQKKQLQEAGLNPALMYGMGGGGGQTAAASAGAGVSSQNAGYQMPTEGIAMGIQMGMMDAQRKLLEAQARNLEADTANKPKVGENIEASTRNLESLTTNTEAKTALAKVELTIQQTEAKIKTATAQDIIDMASWAEVQARENLEKASRENFIGKATQNAAIDTIRARYVTALLENQQIRAQIGLTEQMTATERQKVTNMVQELMMKWDSLGLDQRKTLLAESMGITQDDPFNKVWGVLEQAMDGILGKRGK